MDIYYYHGRSRDGSRNTFAGCFTKDGRLIIGLSLCSENDSFCKKTGRSIALNRLNHHTKGRGSITLNVEDKKNLNRHYFLEVCKDIEETHSSKEDKMKMFNFPEYKGDKKC